MPGSGSHNTVVPRIAFLTPLPTPYRQPLLERLVACPEWRMTVFYCSGSEMDRRWEVPVPADNGRFRFLPVRSLAMVGKRTFINHWNPTLWRELDQGAFDLIVVPGYALASSQAAILWSWRRRRPYVLHSESHLAEPRSWLRRCLKRWLVRPAVSRAAACLATGSLSKQYLCHYGADPDRVFFFPNTPDVEWFIRQSDRLHLRRSELRQQWGLAEAPTVLFVGRLLQVKGVDVLIEAMTTVRQRVPNAQLAIVGDGPEEAALRDLARRRGVGDAVHFLGFQQRDALVELYVCADVFCLPSRHEPWGVVVNEAAACGLPLVVSDRVGAGPDLVEPGVNGFRVPAEDAAQLGEGLVRFLAETVRRDDHAGVSRSRAQQWGYGAAEASFRRMVQLVVQGGAMRSRC